MLLKFSRPTLASNGGVALLAAIWTFLQNVNWYALSTGAALGAITLGMRTIIQEPVKAVTRDARVIRWIWWLSPQTPFGGRWKVIWRVTSTRFAPENVDVVDVRRFYSTVTFRTSATLLDGSREDCVFVAQLNERKLTGRWHNPEGGDRGYYGTFQLHLHAGLKHGEGAWVGFANDGRVQADDMSMQRVS